MLARYAALAPRGRKRPATGPQAAPPRISTAPPATAATTALRGPGSEMPPGRAANPAGRSSMPSIGQATASTRATTASRDTEPWPASWRWAVEVERAGTLVAPAGTGAPSGTVVRGMPATEAGVPEGR
ncbi:hypothetical protein Sgou_32520 [Streptomyces gougerotii]|uniref:Uncharacterized protein n=1 Tax=Streptomyces gougerotii TaxID=53448 RepID=A0ABQ1D7P8_9ACTN|nr:hypothetical protein Sgou_32520 [Streptomyces gougerotii]